MPQRSQRTAWVPLGMPHIGQVTASERSWSVKGTCSLTGLESPAATPAVRALIEHRTAAEPGQPMLTFVSPGHRPSMAD